MHVFQFFKGKALAVVTTWLGLYPVLTLLAYFLEPYLAPLNVAERSFITSVIMVPIMVIVIMPAMQLVQSKLLKIKLLKSKLWKNTRLNKERA
jgi:antibiotic biosynthesis monooxygenase (ABM) superfamily enzyme